jgi:hypothetical protein
MPARFSACGSVPAADLTCLFSTSVDGRMLRRRAASESPFDGTLLDDMSCEIVRHEDFATTGNDA